MFGSSFAYLIVLTRRKAGKRKRKFPGSYIYLKNDNNKKYKSLLSSLSRHPIFRLMNFHGNEIQITILSAGRFLLFPLLWMSVDVYYIVSDDISFIPAKNWSDREEARRALWEEKLSLNFTRSYILCMKIRIWEVEIKN